ncbi:hypothetical protein U8V72_14960 [Priestia filamentosa]|uniref:hypothetical protein n=1 Tax=Priestia filamentosa TaxID=1402861 RepID=UPI00397CCA11
MKNLNKNFLPSQYNRGPVRKVIRVGYTINLVLGIAVVSLVGICVYMNNNDKQSLEEMEKHINEMDNAVQVEKIKLEENKSYQSYMDIKNKQKSGDIKIIKDAQFNIFAEGIESATNENIQLNDVEYDGEKEVVIKGQALDYLDIQDFYKKLISQKVIKQASISKLEVVPYGEGKNYAVKQVVKFEIEGVTKIEKSK